MKQLSNFIRSFLVTVVISFTFPIIVVASLLGFSFAISYFPGLESIGEIGLNQILTFLSIFGAGSVLRGIVVIGLTIALVGGWFDLYTLYRGRQLKPFNSQSSKHS